MALSDYKIVEKKFPIMANGEFQNGKTIYRKKFTEVGKRTVIFVHSKIDDSLLFESTSRELVERFCETSTIFNHHNTEI